MNEWPVHIRREPVVTHRHRTSQRIRELASSCGLGLAILTSACAGAQSTLKPGQPAPTLVAENNSPATDWRGNEVSLPELMKNGPVVLVFLRGFF